jgi:hypothetical protein
MIMDDLSDENRFDCLRWLVDKGIGNHRTLRRNALGLSPPAAFNQLCKESRVVEASATISLGTSILERGNTPVEEASKEEVAIGANVAAEGREDAFAVRRILVRYHRKHRDDVEIVVGNRQNRLRGERLTMFVVERMVCVQKTILETTITHFVLKEFYHWAKDIHTAIATDRELGVDDCLAKTYAAAEIEQLLVGADFKADVLSHAVQEPDVGLLGRHQ